MLEQPKFSGGQFKSKLSVGDISVAYSRQLKQLLESWKQGEEQRASSLGDVFAALKKIKQEKDSANAQRALVKQALGNIEDIKAYSETLAALRNKFNTGVLQKCSAVNKRLEFLLADAAKEKQKQQKREILKDLINTRTAEIKANYKVCLTNEDNDAFRGNICDAVTEIENCLNAVDDDGTLLFSKAEQSGLRSCCGNQLFQQYCKAGLEQAKNPVQFIADIYSGEARRRFLNSDILRDSFGQQNSFTVDRKQEIAIANQYIDTQIADTEAERDQILTKFIDEQFVSGRKADGFGFFDKLGADAYWKTTALPYFATLMNAAKDPKAVQDAISNVLFINDKFAYLPPSLCGQINGAVSSDNPAAATVGLVALNEIKDGNHFISPTSFSFFDDLGINLFCKNRLDGGTDIGSVIALREKLITSRRSIKKEDAIKLFKELKPGEKRQIKTAITEGVFTAPLDDAEEKDENIPGSFMSNAMNEFRKYYAETGDMDSAVEATKISLRNKYNYGNTSINLKNENVRYPVGRFYGERNLPDVVLRNRAKAFFEKNISGVKWSDDFEIRPDETTEKEIGLGSLTPTYVIYGKDDFGGETLLLGDDNLPVRLGEEAFTEKTPEINNVYTKIDLLRQRRYKLAVLKIKSSREKFSMAAKEPKDEETDAVSKKNKRRQKKTK